MNWFKLFQFAIKMPFFTQFLSFSYFGRCYEEQKHTSIDQKNTIFRLIQKSLNYFSIINNILTNYIYTIFALTLPIQICFYFSI